MTDRLAEIEAKAHESLVAYYDTSNEGEDASDDVLWLIGEVKRYHEIYRLVEPVLKQELYSDEWERIQALRNGDQRTSESAQQLR